MTSNNEQKPLSESVLRLSALMQSAATTSGPMHGAEENTHYAKLVRAEFDKLVRREL